MSANDGVLEREITLWYGEHHGWLRAWLRKRLGDAHQAADLAHDTFMHLLTRDEPVAAREPRAFLTTLAQRVLANHYRRQQLERAYLDALCAMPEPLVQSPEEQAIVLQTLVDIDRMLDGLAPVVKRAFLMSQLDGMAHGEIAAELGISITSVKRYLVRAGEQCYFGAHGVML